MKKVLFLLTCAVVSAWSAININNTVWNTNWNVMFFWQSSDTVSGEYMYDGGILTGILHGDTLRGWWRESGNAKACGPNNDWSGPLVFLFLADSAFTGDWRYCGTDPAALNPNGSSWTGTIRKDSTSYTQQECENAGRFWCNNTCSITRCDSAMTQTACEAAGRFWCDDTCMMQSCDVTSLRNPVSSRIINTKRFYSEKCGFNLQGNSIGNQAMKHGLMILRHEAGILKVECQPTK